MSIMKTSILKVAVVAGMATMLFAAIIVGCKGDDVVKPLPYNGTTGTDAFETTSGNDFAIDKTHSNVNWKTLYQGGVAYLNGKFNSFNIHVNFDEADASKINISAWVSLSSFNTGEPGRDSYGKCGPGYMGVVFDTVSQSPVQLAPRGTTDTARFASTSVVKYGDGYLVKGDLTFKGVTKEVTMPMKYTGMVPYESSTGSKRLYAGLEGEFTFLAKTDYGVSSSSIADEVIVYVNANFRKNL